MAIPIQPPALAEVAILEGVPGWVLALLAREGEERRLPRGALVVEQHAPADTVWVLAEGSVEILLRFEAVGDLLVGVQHAPGSVIGWSAFREPYLYTTSARCEQECRLWALPKRAFDEVFDRDPLVGATIVRRVAATIDARLEGALRFLTGTEPTDAR